MRSAGLLAFLLGSSVNVSAYLTGSPITSHYTACGALQACIEDKTDAAAREGALFAFECLVEKLGRLFEPYVIHVLPMLLVCFGDLSPAVREATDSAARSIMSNLSGQGAPLGPPPPLPRPPTRDALMRRDAARHVRGSVRIRPGFLATARRGRRSRRTGVRTRLSGGRRAAVWPPEPQLKPPEP